MEKEELLNAHEQLERAKKDVKEIVDKYGKELTLRFLELVEEDTEEDVPKKSKRKYVKKKQSAKRGPYKKREPKEKEEVKEEVLSCSNCENKSKEDFYFHGTKADGSKRYQCKKCKKYTLYDSNDKVVYNPATSSDKIVMVKAEINGEEEKKAFHDFRTKKLNLIDVSKRPKVLMEVSKEWNNDKDAIIEKYRSHVNKMKERANTIKETKQRKPVVTSPDESEDDFDRQMAKLGKEPEEDFY